MGIRIKNKGVNGPKNERVVEHANKVLTDIVPKAARQYQNALLVNTVSVLIYDVLTSGVNCTCNRKDSKLLDDDGNLEPGVIDSLLTGSDIHILDYASKGVAQDTLSSELEGISRNPEDSREAVPSIERDFEQDFDLEEINEFSGDDILLDYNSVSCYVCYTTGFVGGYQLSGGQRLVLHVTNDYTSNGLEVDRNVTPNTFVLAKDGQIEFTILVPIAAHILDFIKVQNNRLSLSMDHYVLTVNGNTVTESNFLDLAAKGLPVTLKITALKNIVFTHIEIQMGTQIKPYQADFSKLTALTNQSVLTGVSETSIVCDPSVPRISVGAIIVDALFGKWRTTNVEIFRDYLGNIHGWDISARLVQSYEITNNLVARERSKLAKSSPRIGKSRNERFL